MRTKQLLSYILLSDTHEYPGLVGLKLTKKSPCQVDGRRTLKKQMPILTNIQVCWHQGFLACQMTENRIIQSCQYPRPRLLPRKALTFPQTANIHQTAHQESTDP